MFPDLFIGRQVIQGIRGLPAIGFRSPGLAIAQATLPGRLAEFAMLVEEVRGIPVHRGRLVVNGSRVLVRLRAPALMTLALAIGLAHRPRFPLR